MQLQSTRSAGAPRAAEPQRWALSLTMKVFESKTFNDRFEAYTWTTSMGDYELRHCFFDNCSIAQAKSPRHRLVIRNVIAQNCRQRNCHIWTAILEDVVVDGLKKEGRMPLFTWGAVFKRVILKGKLSALKLNQMIDPLGSRTQVMWDDANTAFYTTVDWALDISEAEFQGAIDLHAIPGTLIRRDPETQVLIPRARLEAIEWQQLDWGTSSLDVALQWFLEDGLYDSVVLVAAKRSTSFQADLQAVRMLRREGVALDN